MRRVVFLIVALGMVACACQETWQEKMVREMREITDKQCPIYLSEGLILDSIVYQPTSNARHNYYTLVDSLIDIDRVCDTTYTNAVHRELVNEVRGSVEVLTLKQHQSAFYYHYRLQSDGRTLHTDSVMPTDYR